MSEPATPMRPTITPIKPAESLADIAGGLLAKQKAASFVEENLMRLAELQKLGKSLVDRLN
jgi:hypothetical protein